MNLYAHQQKLLDKNPKKCGIFWGCGLGKTRMALELIKKNKPAITLIICPKSLVKQWQEQCEHDVIHKELFKKQADTLPRYDCIVIDESHYFEGMQGFKKKSQLLKAILAYNKKHTPNYLYTMTGTPYMSSPWNIYAAAEILGVKYDYNQFKQAFFNEVHMGLRWPIPVVKKGIEPYIAKLVQALGDVVKMEDCFDVPGQIYQEEYFDLTSEQKKAIEAIEDTNHLVRFTKIHQINGGCLKGNGYVETAYYKSEKLARLLDLVQEHKLVAVVCRYNAEIDMISHEITKKFPGKFVRKINGTVPADQRHYIVQDMQKQEDGVIILQASCSEGFQIPNIPIMIFYSMDFSLKNYIQMKARILRADFLKKNIYKFFIVNDSIDMEIYKNIVIKKQDFHIELFRT